MSRATIEEPQPMSEGESLEETEADLERARAQLQEHPFFWVPSPWVRSWVCVDHELPLLPRSAPPGRTAFLAPRTFDLYKRVICTVNRWLEF
jgi:hypothetical protein